MKTETETTPPIIKTMFMSDCKMGFVSADGMTLIDAARPDTLKSWCYDNTLKEIQARYPGATLMAIDDFCRAKAARQDTPIQWNETTEEMYWEMLEVLPPAIMLPIGFLVGEPCDHHAGNGQPRFQAYVKADGKYWAASRPMTVKEFKTCCEKFTKAPEMEAV